MRKYIKYLRIWNTADENFCTLFFMNKYLFEVSNKDSRTTFMTKASVFLLLTFSKYFSSDCGLK